MRSTVAQQLIDQRYEPGLAMDIGLAVDMPELDLDGFR